jgi:hypothetical protein
MKSIYYYIILISLFTHGLAWGESNTPPITASISNSKDTANPNATIITIKNVPINNVPTPIIIKVNPPSVQPIVTNSPPIAQLKQESASFKGVFSKTTRPSKNTIAIPPTLSLDVIIDKKHLNSPKVHKLYKMLGIRTSPQIIHLVAERDLVSKRDGRIMLQPRSFVGVLSFLSNAVEVYPDMLRKKLVISPKYPNGEYFNLNNLTKGLLAIHISPTKPQIKPSVEVFYRNHWFYIEDNDYKSKRTLSMIGQLFNLQASNVKIQTPILTISANPDAQVQQVQQVQEVQQVQTQSSAQ